MIGGRSGNIGLGAAVALFASGLTTALVRGSATVAQRARVAPPVLIIDPPPALLREPGPNEYRCDTCREIFPLSPDAAIAQRELERNFPGLKPADCGRTCDDCFGQIFESLDTA